ncbi:hypothetical protein [Kamptonema formosum]|nr:hypothetical protein [Oscillatoria sp. PCC 10802]
MGFSTATRVRSHPTGSKQAGPLAATDKAMSPAAQLFLCRLRWMPVFF